MFIPTIIIEFLMIPVRKVIRKVGGFQMVAALEGGELKMEVIPPDGPYQSQATFNPDTLPPFTLQIFDNLENILLFLEEEKL